VVAESVQAGGVRFYENFILREVQTTERMFQKQMLVAQNRHCPFLLAKITPSESLSSTVN
jgi:hypothetical protein